jgi:hypothetical protein
VAMLFGRGRIPFGSIYKEKFNRAARGHDAAAQPDVSHEIVNIRPDLELLLRAPSPGQLTLKKHFA